MSTDDLDPASRHLGIALVSVAADRSEVRMTVTDDMTNAHGMAHGGYVFLLADAAFAAAANCGDVKAVAQGAQVTFCKPAYPGDELTAEAVLRASFGRNSIFDVTVRMADGSVVAEFRGQSVILSGRARPAAASAE